MSASTEWESKFGKYIKDASQEEDRLDVIVHDEQHNPLGTAREHNRRYAMDCMEKIEEHLDADDYTAAIAHANRLARQLGRWEK